MCKMLYSMHTDTPLIKEMEEHNERIFNADYTKVDTPTMVNELDISEESKQNLQCRLEKFLELFGGGLGCLNNQKPALMKLKKGTKPHTNQLIKITPPNPSNSRFSHITMWFDLFDYTIDQSEQIHTFKYCQFLILLYGPYICQRSLF